MAYVNVADKETLDLVKDDTVKILGGLGFNQNNIRKSTYFTSISVGTSSSPTTVVDISGRGRLLYFEWTTTPTKHEAGWESETHVYIMKDGVQYGNKSYKSSGEYGQTLTTLLQDDFPVSTCSNTFKEASTSIGHSYVFQPLIFDTGLQIQVYYKDMSNSDFFINLVYEIL